MPLVLQKRVAIANGRLNALYLTIQVSLFGFLLFKFVRLREYEKEMRSSSGLQMSMWTVTDSAKLREAELKILNSTLCTSPGSYDYQWKNGSDWRFEGAQCQLVCVTGQTRPCIQSFSISRQTNSEDIFLTTQQTETLVTKSGTISRQHWVPAVEGFSVGLKYYYQASNSMQFKHNMFPYEREIAGAGSSLEEMVTILVKDGKPWKKLEPIKELVLSVHDILNLAGIPNFLDEINEAAGPNVLQGATHRKGPVGRLSGVEIKLRLECSDRRPSNIDFTDFLSSYQGTVCYLSASKTLRPWVFQMWESSLDPEGGVRHVLLHGIRIICESDSTFHKMDVKSVFNYLISLLVLWKVPKVLITIFMTNCLGQLSAVYTRALNESFHEVESFGDTAIRLAKDWVAFKSLTGSNSAIDKKTLSRALKALFPDLPADSLGKIAVICCRRAEITGTRVHTMFLRVFEELKLRKVSQMPDKHEISVQHFCKACIGREPVDFRTLAALFKEDHRLRFFERVFMPVRLSTAVRERVPTQWWSSEDRSSFPESTSLSELGGSSSRRLGFDDPEKLNSASSILPTTQSLSPVAVRLKHGMEQETLTLIQRRQRKRLRTEDLTSDKSAPLDLQAQGKKFQVWQPQEETVSLDEVVELAEALQKVRDGLIFFSNSVEKDKARFGDDIHRLANNDDVFKKQLKQVEESLSQHQHSMIGCQESLDSLARQYQCLSSVTEEITAQNAALRTECLLLRQALLDLTLTTGYPSSIQFRDAASPSMKPVTGVPMEILKSEGADKNAFEDVDYFYS